jgi:hydrogenase expression/formation protein HypE
MNERIMMSHGSGGAVMNGLIREVFIHHFGDEILGEESDSAVVPFPKESHLAFTTDGYVVDPIFFPGGDIGKLAVCGTINDLAVSGACPLWLSASFILEEGFPLNDLKRIVSSMATEARTSGIRIVCGDTKVVPRGKGDKIFIVTSGIGRVEERFLPIRKGSRIQSGDNLIVSGTLGDHGMAVLLEREKFPFEAKILSDCANLFPMIREVLSQFPEVCFMRDATRGGLATILCEVAEKVRLGIQIFEEQIPVASSVRNLCELLGFDPLYLANEGKALFIVPGKQTDEILQAIRAQETGREAAVIGSVVSGHSGRVVMNTLSGGERMIDYLSGDQLPRIC